MELAALQNVTHNFTHEIELSAQGEKTSLDFIKNTIPNAPIVHDGETFQVMVIGGTNFFKALLTESHETFTIQQEEHLLLPTFATQEDFFTFLSGQVDPTITVLAINFGFAIEPVFARGKLEATFLTSAKQSTFAGLIGKNICEEFEKYMQEKHNRTLKVSIANDTICLLLSGLTQHNGTNLAAGIVGTGVNFAIFLDKTTLINLEAGSFNKFPQSTYFEKVNNGTNNPHDHFFEKEISGGYLYQHFNMALQDKQLNFPPLKDTAQLSTLAEERQDDVGQMAKELLQRSAQLVACVIAGIMEFKKSGMTFVMQGSVFWKGYQYEETVEKMLKELCPDYKATFIRVEHADLLGAAKLVA